MKILKKEKEPLAFAKIKYYIYEEEEEKCRANITLFLKATEDFCDLIKELRDSAGLFGQRLRAGWGERVDKIKYRCAICSISATDWNELEQKINEKLQEIKERLQQILKRNRELRKTMPKEKQVVLL